MHLEEDVLFSDMASDWLWFFLKTPEWHKKYNFYQLTNPPRSWFPSKCSFSDHRGLILDLPEKNSQRKQAGGTIHRQLPCLLVPTFLFLSPEQWGLTESCYSGAAFLSLISVKWHLCSTETSLLLLGLLPSRVCAAAHTQKWLSRTPALCPHMVSMTWLSFPAPIRNTPGKILSYI